LGAAAPAQPSRMTIPRLGTRTITRDSSWADARRALSGSTKREEGENEPGSRRSGIARRARRWWSCPGPGPVRAGGVPVVAPAPEAVAGVALRGGVSLLRLPTGLSVLAARLRPPRGWRFGGQVRRDTCPLPVRGLSGQVRLLTFRGQRGQLLPFAGDLGEQFV